MKNPFGSDIFKKKYTSHFLRGKKTYSFDIIQGVDFYKHTLYPLYINLGRNLTKGMIFKVDPSKQTGDIRNKCLFTYDVPDFCETQSEMLPSRHRVIRVKQYPGYYIALKGYKNIDAYLKQNFSKPSRYKMRKYRRRLENGYSLRYVMYHQQIEKDTFTQLFDQFLKLLKKRYSSKEIRNNNLDPREWAFYKDLAFDMILDGQATLFVIYDEDIPISISYSYIHGSTLISAMTVFDTDYSSFHVGSVSIWKQLEWCLENGIDRFDFSKGHYDYKAHWATDRYQFHHHIIYDKYSLRSSAIALYLKVYHGFKYLFRTRNLNLAYNKIRYKLKKYPGYSNLSPGSFETEVCQVLPDLRELHKIDRMDGDFAYINQPLNSFVYLNQDHVSEVEIYKEAEKNIFYLKGKEAIERVCFL